MKDRADCPVLTCTRDMPAGQVMCVRCWERVPKELRRKLDSAKGGSRVAGTPLADLRDQAVAAAQAVRS